MMMSYGVMGLVTILWSLIGYSLAFGPTTSVRISLDDAPPDSHRDMQDTAWKGIAYVHTRATGARRSSPLMIPEAWIVPEC